MEKVSVERIDANQVCVDTRTDTEREMDHLRHENDMLTKAGIIEVAVRNASVAEYMNHWETRAGMADKYEILLRGIIKAARDMLRERP